MRKCGANRAEDRHHVLAADPVELNPLLKHSFRTQARFDQLVELTVVERGGSREPDAGDFDGDEIVRLGRQKQEVSTVRDVQVDAWLPEDPSGHVGEVEVGEVRDVPRKLGDVDVPEPRPMGGGGRHAGAEPDDQRFVAASRVQERIERVAVLGFHLAGGVALEFAVGQKRQRAGSCRRHGFVDRGETAVEALGVRNDTAVRRRLEVHVGAAGEPLVVEVLGFGGEERDHRDRCGREPPAPAPFQMDERKESEGKSASGEELEGAKRAEPGNENEASYDRPGDVADGVERGGAAGGAHRVGGAAGHQVHRQREKRSDAERRRDHHQRADDEPDELAVREAAHQGKSGERSKVSGDLLPTVHARENGRRERQLDETQVEQRRGSALEQTPSECGAEPEARQKREEHQRERVGAVSRDDGEQVDVGRLQRERDESADTEEHHRDHAMGGARVRRRRCHAGARSRRFVGPPRRTPGASRVGAP